MAESSENIVEVKIKVLTENPEEFSLQIKQDEGENLMASDGEIEQSWKIEKLEDLIEFSPESFDYELKNFAEPGPSNWNMGQDENSEVDGYSDPTKELLLKFAEFEAEHSKIRNHPCMMCNIVFSKHYQLQSHKKKMHLSDPQLKKVKQVAHLNFKCLTCRNFFHSKKGLEHHMVLHDPPKKLKCPKCEFRTVNQPKMDRHQLTHLNVKRNGPEIYDCPAKSCEFTTNIKTRLMIHWKEHQTKIVKRQKKNYSEI